MQLDFQTGTLLLLVATIVAMLTKRLRLPYSVGLVAAGIGLAAIPYAPQVNVTKSLIYTGLLPPLIFEAAYQIQWKELRRNALVVGTFASLGVLLSAAATAAGMHFLLGWPWISALLFGTLIAATDPVTVIAIFREARAHGRLLLLIESESLLNDGTAAVAFALVVAFAGGQALGTGGVLLMLIKSIGGGILCGAAVGTASLLLTGRTDDHLVEITCTTIAAYGSFLLADTFDMSGILATIAAGLVMRNFKKIDGITPRGKEAIEHFWEYAAFVANSMIFLLIGIQQSHERSAALWFPCLGAIAVVAAGRAVAVYSCSALFTRSALRISAKQQHVLFWGGLRGAVALALVLGLSPQVPLHDEIVAASFAVVAFSIFVQGATMAPLLRRFGEIPPKHKSAA